MRAGPDRGMRLSEYESIRAHLLSLPCARYPDMDVLKASHPGVSLDTLVSISSQESSRRIKAHHGRHARQIEVHASRYLSGEDIFHVAHDVDFPPCQLLRLLIEHPGRWASWRRMARAQHSVILWRSGPSPLLS